MIIFFSKHLAVWKRLLNFASDMTANRNRTKSQHRQTNIELAAVERVQKQTKERKALQGKLSEILINLATLVFGGAIIGGVFQENGAPVYLYVTAVMAFAILMWWGLYYFKKSIKED